MNKKERMCFIIRKSVFCFLIAFFCIFLSALSISAEALDSSAKSWSVQREKDHKQPTLISDFCFISDFGGYYIDKNAKDDDKVIYLTFDAGYENGNIEKILDTMKKYDVKGAFFILENLIKRNTDLVKRMADEGHTVCNHTARHKDMTKITDMAQFKSELDKLESVYKEYTGLEMSKYYRPPEGKFSKQNLEFANKLGYKTIFWSFAYADWDNNKQPDKDSAIKKITENTHNGMVVLLHPTSATNAEILDDLISYWKNEDYRFGSLDELTSVCE